MTRRIVSPSLVFQYDEEDLSPRLLSLSMRNGLSLRLLSLSMRNGLSLRLLSLSMRNGLSLRLLSLALKLKLHSLHHRVRKHTRIPNALLLGKRVKKEILALEKREREAQPPTSNMALKLPSRSPLHNSQTHTYLIVMLSNIRYLQSFRSAAKGSKKAFGSTFFSTKPIAEEAENMIYKGTLSSEKVPPSDVFMNHSQTPSETFNMAPKQTAPMENLVRVASR